MQAHDISVLRDHIDLIDTEIVELLSKRAVLALEIGRLKRAGGLCVFDPSREQQVLGARLNENQGPLPASSVKRIFAEIISACRALQGPTRVAYLGPEGTFSHLACLDHFGSSCELMPLGSIEDIFRQVEREQADFGVVPVENSTEGAVGTTLDQLADSSLTTCGEIFIRISHALMSQHRNTEEIQTVLSHPQALAQCRAWLAGNLPGRNLISMSSTAAAAIRAGAETGTAVVGNSVLADLCGLEVLAKEIQDQSLNQTRFLVIGHERSYPTGRDKTSILFSTPHSPGALLKTLVPFAENGVNLTKIESRPAKNVPWNYIFFVDFEGHLEDEKVNRALHALRTCVNRLKILGSYPAGQLLQERSGARHNLPVVHRVLGQSQCERRPTKSVGSGPSRAGHTGGGNQGPHGVPNPCSRG